MESEGSAAPARAGAGAGARVRAAAAPRSAASSAAAAAAAEGAAKFLVGLPSSGNFSSSTIPSSNLGGIRVYVCEHDTEPPEGQIVKTDTTNILIRSLQISKQKSEANDAKAAERKGKRSGARNSDGRSPAKRANTGAAVASSRQGGFSEQTLQAMTVERLRVLLKERGLSTRGKKDAVIARLMNEGA